MLLLCQGFCLYTSKVIRLKLIFKCYARMSTILWSSRGKFSYNNLDFYNHSLIKCFNQLMTDCVVFSCHVSYEVEDYDILYDGKRNLIWLCPGLLQCHAFSDATYECSLCVCATKAVFREGFSTSFCSLDMYSTFQVILNLNLTLFRIQ